MVITLTEEIIIQSEPEKQDENQILEKNFYNVSDSDLKFLQRVRFRNKIFTTRQILQEYIYLKSMILKKKIFFKSTSLKKKIILKSRI